MLFLTIAEHESNIEEVRQDLCAAQDFVPRKLFDYIDEERDDKITVDELQQFIFDNADSKEKNTKMELECLEQVSQEIITEFDTDMDGALNYQEFLNVFLPSTNENLRKLCLSRGVEDTERALSPFTLKLAANIVCYEKSLAFQKLLFRRNLFKVKCFEPYQAFLHLCSFSRLKEVPDSSPVAMDMSAMTQFLESSMVPAQSTFAFLHQAKQAIGKQGPLGMNFDPLDPRTFKANDFVPLVVTNFHLEAILRRCDHDGDGKLNYQEFLEVIKGVNVINPMWSTRDEESSVFDQESVASKPLQIHQSQSITDKATQPTKRNIKPTKIEEQMQTANLDDDGPVIKLSPIQMAADQSREQPSIELTERNMTWLQEKNKDQSLAAADRTDQSIIMAGDQSTIIVAGKEPEPAAVHTTFNNKTNKTRNLSTSRLDISRTEPLPQDIHKDDFEPRGSQDSAHFRSFGDEVARQETVPRPKPSEACSEYLIKATLHALCKVQSRFAELRQIEVLKHGLHQMVDFQSEALIQLIKSADDKSAIEVVDLRSWAGFEGWDIDFEVLIKVIQSQSRKKAEIPDEIGGVTHGELADFLKLKSPTENKQNAIDKIERHKRLELTEVQSAMRRDLHKRQVLQIFKKVSEVYSSQKKTGPTGEA